MFHKLFLTLLICCFMVMPILGGSTTTVYASGGSMTYSHTVSIERADGGLKYPVFGTNNTGSPYTYDGSQTSVLTLGRSSMKRESKVDTTDSNFYAAQGSVAGDYMINAEDTAGMLNIQPNEPEQSCHTLLFSGHLQPPLFSLRLAQNLSLHPPIFKDPIRINFEPSVFKEVGIIYKFYVSI